MKLVGKERYGIVEVASYECIPQKIPSFEDLLMKHRKRDTQLDEVRSRMATELIKYISRMLISIMRLLMVKVMQFRG